MKILVFSDPHITYNSLDELEKSFDWIHTTAKEKDINSIIMLGDYYDKKTPHIDAFLFGTKWAKKFVDDFEEVIFLNGNHDNVKNTSNLEYLRYMGVLVVDDYKIEEKGYSAYFGHFFTKQTPLNYGKNFKDITKIKRGKKNFNHILLGHFHDFIRLSTNAWHIGSTRYVSFGENEKEDKKIAIIDTKEKTIEFLSIPTTIKIKTVYDFKELSKINKNTKVRIIFNNFNDYKAVVNKIDKYKNKFVDFKIKMDYKDTVLLPQNKESVSNEVLVCNFLDQIENTKVKKILIELFEKYGIYNAFSKKTRKNDRTIEE